MQRSQRQTLGRHAHHQLCRPGTLGCGRGQMRIRTFDHLVCPAMTRDLARYSSCAFDFARLARSMSSLVVQRVLFVCINFDPLGRRSLVRPACRAGPNHQQSPSAGPARQADLLNSYRWYTGRNLYGSCRIMVAMAVPYTLPTPSPFQEPSARFCNFSSWSRVSG